MAEAVEHAFVDQDSAGQCEIGDALLVVHEHWTESDRLNIHALGGEVVYLDDDEVKMHSTEVFDVARPWENLKSRLPKN